MGNISSKLFANKEMFVLVIGLDLSGKTTILYKFKCDKVFDTRPTWGVCQDDHTYNGVDLCWFDLGGEDRVRALWSSHCDYPDSYGNLQSNCYLYVFAAYF